MNSKEKLGAMILAGFFLVVCIILFFTIDRPDGELRSIENNVIIEQRMKNRDLN